MSSEDTVDTGKPSTENNKALIRHVVEKAWKPSVIEEFCASDYVIHFGRETLTRDDLIEFMSMLHSALMDLRFTADDIIAEGDKVVTRWTASGTHQGVFQGIQPTGNQVVFTGITISRIENGIIVEDWEEVDQLNFTQQFGVFPEV
ncbi:ester cyclase [Methanohalobium sp.]|uniref:ester cyclase n=1 Tax=Methanohalobium sp. TaxID=2837493 RepID=UPI0025FC428E|nr:ester cyclase [Methanohalobium sp.]